LERKTRGFGEKNKTALFEPSLRKKLREENEKTLEKG